MLVYKIVKISLSLDIEPLYESVSEWREGGIYAPFRKEIKSTLLYPPPQLSTADEFHIALFGRILLEEQYSPSFH